METVTRMRADREFVGRLAQGEYVAYFVSASGEFPAAPDSYPTRTAALSAAVSAHALGRWPFLGKGEIIARRIA